MGAICLSEDDIGLGIQPLDDDTISTSRAALNISLDPGYALSLEFVRLQQSLGRVAVETELGSDRSSAALSIPTDAVFVTMLKYMMTSGKQLSGLDLPSQMISYSKALRQITECIEVLGNATLHRQLSEALVLPWNQVDGYASFPMSGRLVDAFKLCRQQFAAAGNSKGDTGADRLSAVDSILRQYMNRTLETVSHLSHTVQTTLDRVKTLPDELFAENKTAKKISRKLAEAVDKLNSKVQSGWKHVSNRFDDVRKKWFGYSGSKKMCKQQKKKDERKQKEEQKDRKQSDDNDDRFADKRLKDSDDKVRDGKRSYKQTRSAPTGRRDGAQHPQKKKQMEEKLSLSSQLDDFFEDNQRAWRQHNNGRLRKVGGRIERLSEEMLLSMDDDDVEDIYEDLKDVAKDVQKRDKSDDVRTWMSCQLRWWKTRIHRKHRAEDLVRGCGRQLMHWQLRVLCKREPERDTALPDRRHTCDSLMSPSVIPQSEARRQSSDVPPAPQSVADRETPENWIEAGRNDSCSDGGWYFRRSQVREDRRQIAGAQWYFDRVEDRQFSRFDANWYARAIHHNAAVSPLAYTNYHSARGDHAKGDTGHN